MSNTQDSPCSKSHSFNLLRLRSNYVTKLDINVGYKSRYRLLKGIKLLQFLKVNFRMNIEIKATENNGIKRFLQEIMQIVTSETSDILKGNRLSKLGILRTVAIFRSNCLIYTIVRKRII